MSLPTYPLCFPEWDPIGDLLSYGLYWRVDEEHITPIEHIPNALVSESRRKSCPGRRRGQPHAQVHSGPLIGERRLTKRIGWVTRPSRPR